MKKSKVIRVLSECVDPHRMCRVVMKYDKTHYTHFFPLKVNGKFFLGAVEDDFQLDGFRICRVKQVKKACVRDDKCLEIDISEGVVDSLYTPKVNLSDWRHIFRSLQAMNRLVMIAHDEPGDAASELFIGSVISVDKHSVTVRCFNCDGVWDDAPTEIPFQYITSVAFGSRYVDVFAKYLPKL